VRGHVEDQTVCTHHASTPCWPPKSSETWTTAPFILFAFVLDPCAKMGYFKKHWDREYLDAGMAMLEEAVSYCYCFINGSDNSYSLITTMLMLRLQQLA